MKIKKYHKQLSAICLLLLLTLILILINFDFLDNKSDNKKKSLNHVISLLLLMIPLINHMKL